MHEFFIPLPLDTPPTYKRVRGVSLRRINVQTTGDFVAVRDYIYIKVAKRIGEVQVGINLFYLLDKSVIIGYRNAVGYYLRQGANGKRSNKQKRLSTVP